MSIYSLDTENVAFVKQRALIKLLWTTLKTKTNLDTG